jgi:hypothetical protein
MHFVCRPQLLLLFVGSVGFLYSLYFALAISFEEWNSHRAELSYFGMLWILMRLVLPFNLSWVCTVYFIVQVVMLLAGTTQYEYFGKGERALMERRRQRRQMREEQQQTMAAKQKETETEAAVDGDQLQDVQTSGSNRGSAQLLQQRKERKEKNDKADHGVQLSLPKRAA